MFLSSENNNIHTNEIISLIPVKPASLTIFLFPIRKIYDSCMSDAKTLVNFRIALEVLRNRLARDVLDRELCQRLAVDFKTAIIGRENQRATRFEQRGGVPNQRLVIALNIERVLHALGARECRRIEKDQTITPWPVFLEPYQHIGLDQLVFVAGDAV